jgi:uncharacterized membrane protein
MNDSAKDSFHPFRRAVLRGLGIVMPSLLTIVLFIAAWNIIESRILIPAEGMAFWAYGKYTQEVLVEVPLIANKIVEDGDVKSFRFNNRLYVPKGGKWVGQYSEEYIKNNKLQRTLILPLFISIFLLVLYLLGKFVAAGLGRLIVSWFESLINRLPLVSNVYSSVKQVTDFLFTEREIEFNRVVAIEYPRKGIWSIGFVTGDSMLDVRSAANEPVLSVLMPTSPMPMTGFTITVLKSEAVDLNISVDQAIQFVVSCGVVVPASQQIPATDQVSLRISSAIAQRTDGNGAAARKHIEAEKETRESSE